MNSKIKLIREKNLTNHKETKLSLKTKQSTEQMPRLP